MDARPGPRRLEYFPIGFCGSTMDLTGLSIAWRAAHLPLRPAAVGFHDHRRDLCRRLRGIVCCLWDQGGLRPWQGARGVSPPDSRKPLRNLANQHPVTTHTARSVSPRGGADLVLGSCRNAHIRIDDCQSVAERPSADGARDARRRRRRGCFLTCRRPKSSISKVTHQMGPSPST
jgi:hypothetical protein